ncbi:hypothetical protein LWI28_023900 [Acer negundo]|uniref:Uncharacterized protein n=1 Tax=Acer negundo TaxID=4023 RepID=A0AAD5J807_ACENE|nr:hypothetical protein LWI28_023900 [Acer negundo]
MKSSCCLRATKDSCNIGDDATKSEKLCRLNCMQSLNSKGDVTTPILGEFTLEGDLNTTIQLIQDSRVSHPYDWKEEDFLDLEDKDSCNSKG